MDGSLPDDKVDSCLCSATSVNNHARRNDDSAVKRGRLTQSYKDYNDYIYTPWLDGIVADAGDRQDCWQRLTGLSGAAR